MPVAAPQSGQVGIGEAAGPRRPRLLAALLLLAYLLTAGLELGTPPVTTKREDRCHDIVRNMLHRGDWVVPWRMGGPWINKPPLFYWAAATTATVSGGYSLWALRLPPYLAGAALMLLVLVWGRRLGGWAVGLLAAALLLPMKGLQDMAREGSAEMLLAALCGWALYAYDSGMRRGRPGRLGVVAALLALGILTKATVALMIVTLPIVVDLVWRRRLGEAFTARRVTALLLALTAGSAWYLWILSTVPGAWDRLFSELVLPVGVEMPDHTQTHYGPPTEHIGSMLRVTLPVLLLWPLVIWRALRTRLWRDDPGWRFVAVVLLTVFVAFSLIPKKRTDYMLPLLPFAALLLAESTRACMALAPGAWRRILRVLGVVTLLGGGLGAAVVALWYGEALGGGVPALVTVGLLGGGLLAAALVWAWKGASGRFAAAALAAWLLGLLTYQASMEVHKRFHMAGIPEAAPGYDAGQWVGLHERYPDLLEGFEPEERWVANLQEQPGAEIDLDEAHDDD